VRRLSFIFLSIFLLFSFPSKSEDLNIWKIIGNDKYDGGAFDYLSNLRVDDIQYILSQKEANDKIPNFTSRLLSRVSATNSNPDVIKIIIENGGDVDYHDDMTPYPLGLAAGNNKNIDVIKLLVSKGANINAKGYEGQTPLLRALKYTPNLDIARYLIEAGADVKAKDKNGNTALIYLFDREPKVDAPDIVQKLIDGGVDVNDYDLKNPLEYAHVCKLKKSEKLLIKAGAKMKKENSPERLERIDFNCEKYSTYSWADIQINLH